jgi:tRNA-splicing ligase RtcB
MPLGVKLEKIDRYRYLIPRHGKMRVEGLIYADEHLMKGIEKDECLVQVANVAHLPGIVGRSLAMPDIHWGYGFPIGGVAAFDLDEGVVSPGGVGYDINCGVRLLKTNLELNVVRPHIKDLIGTLFRNVPCGVGSKRKDFKIPGHSGAGKVARDGAAWAVAHGFGESSDLEKIEDHGSIPGGDIEVVSERAIERGKTQLGTLGSGNHFIEVQYVQEVYDDVIASAMGLKKGAITISIHTGSRGFGYQICDDYIVIMDQAASKYKIEIPDRQLCCAPVKSPEGRQYLAAMAAAANFAFANRQIIMHWVIESFEEVLNISPREHGIGLVYDVCHNIAKIEDHKVGGVTRKLCVHRKGATRAFPVGHPQVPEVYKNIGQPVLVPGDMGRYSYVLVGGQGALEETFGSCCHGAGRLMSRHQAMKACRGRPIVRELEDKGIYIRSAGLATVAEEMPEAYKDVAEVVDVVEGAGLGKKVAKLCPIGVVKG